MSERPTGDGEKQPLRQRAARGVTWTSASAFVAMGTQIAQLAILARLLSPREFGLAASVMVVLGFAATMADPGISHAIIAKHTRDRLILSSLYWTNIIAGAVMSVAIVAAIPAIAAYFGQSELEGLLLLAAPTPLIAAVGLQFQILMQRDLDFSRLARIEIISSLVGLGAAVALAYEGAGAGALVGGYLAQTAFRAVQLCLHGWSGARPAFRLRRRDLDGYLSFGLYQTGTRITNYFSTNMDYILIGGFLGPAAMGVYSVAYKLITIPQLRLNPILTRVAFPVFAQRRDDDAALCRGLLEATRIVGFVTFPILVGFAVTAPVLVPVLFGPGWEESVLLIQILAIPGAFFALGNLQGSVFLAKNRPDVGFKLNIARLVLVTGAFLPAVQIGVEAVAWAFVGVTLVMFVITRMVLWRVVGLSFRSYLLALREPAGVALAMGAVVLLLTPVLQGLIAGDRAILAVQASLGVVTYAGLIALTARQYALEMWRLVATRSRNTQVPNRA